MWIAIALETCNLVQYVTYDAGRKCQIGQNMKYNAFGEHWEKLEHERQCCYTKMWGKLVNNVKYNAVNDL